jgi:hypothetical protein
VTLFLVYLPLLTWRAPQECAQREGFSIAGFDAALRAVRGQERAGGGAGASASTPSTPRPAAAAAAPHAASGGAAAASPYDADAPPHGPVRHAGGGAGGAALSPSPSPRESPYARPAVHVAVDRRAGSTVVSGKTYDIKEMLKALGFRFAQGPPRWELNRALADAELAQLREAVAAERLQLQLRVQDASDAHGAAAAEMSSQTAALSQAGTQAASQSLTETVTQTVTQTYSRALSPTRLFAGGSQSDADAALARAGWSQLQQSDLDAFFDA